MTENANEALGIQAESQTPPAAGEFNSPDSVFVLRLFAWLDLIGAFIGAIWIWSEFGSTGSYYGSQANPVGIAVGVAVLAQGMFGCALLLVIASTGENIAAMRWWLFRRDRALPKENGASTVEEAGIGSTRS